MSEPDFWNFEKNGCFGCSFVIIGILYLVLHENDLN